MAEIIRPALGMWQTFEERCQQLIDSGGQMLTRRSTSTSPLEPDDGIFEIYAEHVEVTDNYAGKTTNIIDLILRDKRFTSGGLVSARVQAELDNEFRSGQVTYSLPRPASIRQFQSMLEDFEISLKLPFKLEWMLEPLEPERRDLVALDESTFSGFIETGGPGTWVGPAVLSLLDESSKFCVTEKRFQLEPHSAAADGQPQQPALAFFQTETAARWSSDTSERLRTIISYCGESLEFEMKGFESPVQKERQPEFVLLLLERSPTMLPYEPQLIRGGGAGGSTASVSHSATFKVNVEQASNFISHREIKIPQARNLRLVNDALKQARDSVEIASFAAVLDGLDNIEL